MKIHLPDELGRSIRPFVLSGQFGSEEEVVVEAVRAFLKQQATEPAHATGMGSIGGMRDAAEDLDQAIEHVTKVREERPWRMAPGE